MLLETAAMLTRPGGHSFARRSLAGAAFALFVMAASGAMAAEPAARIALREDAGVYRVTASFEVPQAAAAALAVLTDYEQMPRFMPNMQASSVVERGAGRTVVEQRATARFMMFSTRVHLVLVVEESSHLIRFHDRCLKSFDIYEGSWTLVDRGESTSLTYELAAKPSFDVPGFVVKRLLRHDASEMIARLRQEMADRAPATGVVEH